MSDFTLLQAYVKGRSEEAFAELVNRHVNLVYSAALRQTRNPHEAVEIVQTVFIILARKAHTIPEGAILAGWLLRTARFTAANARRREQRRQNMEHEAMDHLYATETATDWNEIAPLLDEALVTLGEQDRSAVALRFFEQKSYREIGMALSLSEESARKRVSRALERLRIFLSRRGKVLPVAALAGAMTAHAVQAAPPGLAGTVVVMAISKASVAPAALSWLARGTLATLKWMQWKRAAIPASVAGLALSLVILLAIHHPAAHSFSEQTLSSAPVALMAETHVAAEKLRPPHDSAFTTPAAQQKAPANEHKLLFSVIDSKSGSPVANARLTLTWVTDYPQRLTNTFATDLQGQCLISLDRTPVRNWSSRIEVFKDGYVPKYVSWSASQGDATEDIPLEYKTKVEPGVDIGGSVLNDKGEPIPDVRVVFSVMGPAPGASHDRERLTMMGHYHTEITDAQGHWHCNHVPSQFGMITYQLSHPDYQTESFEAAAAGATKSGGRIYVTEADLRNDSAVFVLKRGLVVAGVVVDESGNPVVNAKVTENRDWRENYANQLTGTDGRFRFANLSNREVILSIQKDGFAPMDTTLHPSEKREERRFQLSKGGTLQGQVVDETGNPIAKARLRLPPDQFNRSRFDWTATTDGKGRFEWLSAPIPRATYLVEAPGFKSEPGVELEADGSEHLVTLRRNATPESFRILGTVVDATTGQPIKAFQVLMAKTASGQLPSGALSFSTGSLELQTTGKDGKFFFHTSGSAVSNLLEVRADGYLPEQSAPTGKIFTDREFDFQLKPAAEISGAVQMPDGMPVAGAMVMLSTKEAQPYMKLPAQFELTHPGNVKRAETDTQGHFSFKPQLGIEKIMVANNLGYAEASLEDLTQSHKIILQLWGRVEGTLKIGNEAGGDQTIELGNWYWRCADVPCFQLHMETKTDANGHFVFEGVPPGERQIAHRVNLRPGKDGPSPSDGVLMKSEGFTYMRIRPWYGSSQVTLIQVQPGQATQVTLGGTGRTVVGRIKATSTTQKIDWQLNEHVIRSKVSRPDAPKHENFASDAEFAQAKEGWIVQDQRFWLSEAGKETQLNSRQYVVVFATDGSFRINDVSPGTYWFNIFVSDPTAPDAPFGGKLIGSVEKEIIVPEPSDANESSLVDLGVFELIPRKP